MNQLPFVLFVWMLVMLPSPGFSGDYDTNSLFFEHWRHYESQGIPCDQCHIPRGNGIFSLPNHKTCELCHEKGMANDYEEAKGPTCGKCHPKNKSGAVTRLSALSRTAKRYFFHSSKLDHLCDVCHGKMLDDLVPLGQLITSQESRVKVRQQAHYFYNKGDCASCHKNMASDIRPENHSADWLKRHKDIAPQFNCKICHTKSFCQDCHESTY